MITASVVQRLQIGQITNVVPYGIAQLPAPPYVVVKTERDAVGRGRLLRVIVHFAADQRKWLEAYVFDELSDLLSDWHGETDDGVHFRVGATQEWTDVTSGNDDGTISMERVFLLPGLLF